MSRPHVAGYSDRWSVEPGDTVEVMLSAHTEVEVHAELVEVGFGTPDGTVDETTVTDLGHLTVRPQRTTVGSCVRAPAPTGHRPDGSLLVSALIMPTRPDRHQVVVSQGREGSGWWLGLVEGARPALTVALDGHIATVIGDRPLQAGAWYAIAGSSEPSGAVKVVAVPLPRSAAWATGPSSSIQPSTGAGQGPPVGLLQSPVHVGALDDGARGWTDCFDGKIESPRLHSAVLDSSVAEALARGNRDLGPLIAGWDFALRPGDDQRHARSVADSGPDGVVLNSPLRAATGHSWDGTELDFRRAPEKYGAIHFHADDLDDCGWEPALRVTVPYGANSTTHAVRVRTDDGLVDRVPLFVRPSAPRSSVALLIPTASYLAYANDHPGSDGRMAQAVAGKTPILREADLLLHEHREWGLSCYDEHSDGSGVAYSSMRRPLLNMRPTHRYHVGEWQYPADLAIVSWLSASGVDYDLITDEVLNDEGAAALEPYRTVVTGTHAEYYSTTMLDGLEQWLDSGGRLVSLGANAYYWRIAFDPDRPWIMETRRGHAGSRAWESTPGEAHLAVTGEPGGLWRHLGRTPQELAAVGYAAQGFDRCGWYRRLPDSNDPRAAFIFDGVDGEVFGTEGRIGGGAVGQEVDRYDRALGSPDDALVLATSEGLGAGYLRCVEELGFSVPGVNAILDPDVRADLVYHVRPGGGAVFSAGSIAWAGSLGVDLGISRITANVIGRFSDPEPLEW